MRDRIVMLAVISLAGVALVLIAALVALGRDPGSLMTAIGLLVTPVFGALLYGEMREVKSQTNGTTSAIVSMLRQQIGQTPTAGQSDVSDDGATGKADPATPTRV